jgi:hypothetical protein
MDLLGLATFYQKILLFGLIFGRLETNQYMARISLPEPRLIKNKKQFGNWRYAKVLHCDQQLFYTNIGG